MIKATGGATRTYEQVVADEWIAGVIEEVQSDAAHTFKYEGQESIHPAVRLKFKLEGYEYPKYSRWMKLFTSERATLYKDILKPMCPTFDPLGKEVDVERLAGEKVKTMWEMRNDFPCLVRLKPLRTDINLILSGADLVKKAVDLANRKAQEQAEVDTDINF